MWDIRVYDSAQECAVAAANLLHERLSAGGRAVLAGGRTPLQAYQRFGHMDLLWHRLQLIPSDERCLGAHHPDRNDNAIAAALGPQKYTLHRFAAELGPQAAAQAMQSVVADLLPFDLALLGLGEDGHTASLFPQNPALQDPALVVPVWGAPKPPPERVSLGLSALSQSRSLVFLVTGSEKRLALAQLLAGEKIPPTQIHSEERIVLVDRSASV